MKATAKRLGKRLDAVRAEWLAAWQAFNEEYADVLWKATEAEGLADTLAAALDVLDGMDTKDEREAITAARLAKGVGLERFTGPEMEAWATASSALAERMDAALRNGTDALDVWPHNIPTIPEDPRPAAADYFAWLREAEPGSVEAAAACDGLLQTFGEAIPYIRAERAER